ncbi:MAG: hypothetical protein AB200_00055 [Parcubacteria bacterium C7867-005]|nr:MAG: hypothetical protein AB200_00055 [Parcubacteria bacterium C7867-005]
MSPEEKELLRRTLKLSEDNNRILLRLQSSARWQAFWSLIKILFIVLPLVVGYILLQPYFGSAKDTLEQAKSLLDSDLILPR